MLSVDHSNIDGPPLAVKCVRKFGSALGGEVMSACVCCACVLSYCNGLKNPYTKCYKIAKCEEFLFVQQ